LLTHKLSSAFGHGSSSRAAAERLRIGLCHKVARLYNYAPHLPKI
jgi:hypothetical protein